MSTLAKQVFAPSVAGVAAMRPWWAVLKFAIGVALLLSAWGALVSPQQLGERCIVAFGFLLTVGLGGLFFVLLHYVLGARWSATAVVRSRGIVELTAIAMLFVVPIALCVDQTWPWFVHDTPGHAIGNSATAYQSTPFLLARLLVCCASWLGLGYYFTGIRHRVAATNDAVDKRRRFWSGPALVVYAMTVTCFSFDWVMTLQSSWQSAVLGVYVFAGGVPAALAVLALISVSPETADSLDVLDLKARHDIGKLLFGFTVFWGYIAFSQYLLIWYADLPSEIGFYHLRTSSNWRTLTYGLIVLRFGVPFLTLLSARAKQSSRWLTLAACSALIGHWLDWYWLVMPALSTRGPRLSVADIGMAALSLLGVGWGILRSVTVQTRKLSQASIQSATAEIG